MAAGSNDTPAKAVARMTQGGASNADIVKHLKAMRSEAMEDGNGVKVEQCTAEINKLGG